MPKLPFLSLFEKPKVINTPQGPTVTTLEAVFDGINEIVVVLNPSKQVIFTNNLALNLLKQTKQQIYMKPINQVLVVTKDGKQIPETTYCPIRSDNFSGNIFEMKDLEISNILAPTSAPTTATQKNMKTSFNLTVKQIPNGVSLGVGAILLIQDNSVEKQLEAMKLDFVSMAAHELRTPLTSLKGYLSVFAKEGEGKFSSDQQMFIDRMTISTQTLMSLIENLLNVSRVERGAMTMYKEQVDWTKMVNQIVDDYKLRAKEKNITLDFLQSTQPIPHLLVDKLRICEVLYNLIANAINYTAPGGSIQVWIDTNGEFVTTHVKDTGEGIPQEAIPNLFTKFFRVGGNLEQGSKGTGLGLYIAKSIMDMHQGKIWVNSEIGKGSVFSFSVPVPKELHPDISVNSVLKNG